MLRYVISLDGYTVIHIFNGAILIIVSAVCLGIISGGNKLYEIVFFLLTYRIVNKIPLTDYLGSQPHGNQAAYMSVMVGLNVFLVMTGFMARNYQARHL
jgi:hypothetical protein